MELIGSYQKTFKRKSKIDEVFRYHKKGLEGFGVFFYLFKRFNVF
jgi:hypothetical protein